MDALSIIPVSHVSSIGYDPLVDSSREVKEKQVTLLRLCMDLLPFGGSPSPDPEHLHTT